MRRPQFNRDAKLWQLYTARLQRGGTMMRLACIVLCLPALAWAIPLPHPDVVAIDAEVAAVFDRLEAAQADFISGKPEGPEPAKRYVQVLSPAVASDGTTATKPDLVNTVPSHRIVGLDDLGITAADRLRADYVADEYWTADHGASTRRGYLLHAEVAIAGEKWRRTRQVGPENRGFEDSAMSWYVVDER